MTDNEKWAGQVKILWKGIAIVAIANFTQLLWDYARNTTVSNPSGKQHYKLMYVVEGE